MQTTPDGFETTSTPFGDQRVAIRWASINRILAVKQDLFRPDIINLLITYDDGEIELNEADCGSYPVFTRLLQLHLAGVPGHTAWLGDATNPVKAHAEVVLYERKN